MRALPFLLLLACATRLPLAGSYAAPVLAHEMRPGRLGETVCAWNNLPIVLVDSAVLRSEDAEIILVHEQTHASRALAYRGGCWPYLRRYLEDKAFRVGEELTAYCAEGRFAISRNRDPVAAWARIKWAVSRDTILNDKQNCLYDPW